MTFSHNVLLSTDKKLAPPSSSSAVALKAKRPLRAPQADGRKEGRRASGGVNNANLPIIGQIRIINF